MYRFDYREIIAHPLHQIEYSIIDTCNRNCKACSHFSPLAKRANPVSEEEFLINIRQLHSLIPDVHTFWLIGGEPTLHPKYIELLRLLRDVYHDIPIGVMSNGYGILKEAKNKKLWEFIKENQIVWRITTYNIQPDVYRNLFEQNGCRELLSLDVNNRFIKLAVLTKKEQPITQEKYNLCGWERLNIFVRNGRIWKCPTVEYIDLFNGYFHENYELSDDDFLKIDSTLTRERIIEFKNKPSAFCKNCNISKRLDKAFPVITSQKEKSEWQVMSRILCKHLVNFLVF